MTGSGSRRHPWDMLTRRRGLALLVVVGVLAVLMVLAAAFVTLARLERRASQQRLHATKALLLARSGIEDALARLASGQDPEADVSRYRGEDWNPDGILNAGPETDGQVYQPGQLDTDACPVQHAMRPSFFKALGVNPRLVVVDGRPRGYSGLLGGDCVPEGNTYALKIKSGGIFVNDLDAPMLRRILGNLAEAIDRQGADDGQPLDQTDGWRLIDNRPATGWSSWSQIRDIALGGSQAKLDAIRPDLTLHAWMDGHVIRPNASTAMISRPMGTSPYYQTWSDLRTGLDAAGIPLRGAPLPDFRAPVPLGWARHRLPVLLALFGDLEGLWLSEKQAQPEASSTSSGEGANSLGILVSDKLANTWDPADDCHRAAQQLLSCTSDLATWDAWDALCDGMSLSGNAGSQEAKRSILKANANPNSDLNKFNPNALLARPADKMDLLAYAPEFSLFPSTSVEIESLGLILDAQGRLLASRTARTEQAPPEIVRLTTQSEFVCEHLGNLQRAGDESNPRLPREYLSGNRVTLGGSTWGCRMPSAVAGGGSALQAYPEPYLSIGGSLQINPATYDGCLQLATMETAADETYGVGGLAMKMLASYDDGMDLDSGTKGALTLLPDTRQAPTGSRLLDPIRPGTLNPDGAYSEWQRTPQYPDAGSANGLHGILGFWVKPSYASAQKRGRAFVTWSNYTIPLGGGLSQFFAVTNAMQSGGFKPTVPMGIQAHFEITHDTADDQREHRFQIAHPPTLGNWTLVTFYWNFQGASADETGELIVNGGSATAPSDVDAVNHYGTNNNASGMASDLCTDDAYGAHRISLGGRTRSPVPTGGSQSSILGLGADATIDEFVLYDCPTDKSLPEVLALKRFRAGRYYKGGALRSFTQPPTEGEAGAWVSGPIQLPGNPVLRQVHWTWRRPASLPGDDPVVELLKSDLSSPAHLWKPEDSTSGIPTSLGASWRVGRSVTEPFRLRVQFSRASGPMDLDTPILQSPVLDDLTLVYDPAGGPRLLAWDP